MRHSLSERDNFTLLSLPLFLHQPTIVPSAHCAVSWTAVPTGTSVQPTTTFHNSSRKGTSTQGAALDQRMGVNGLYELIDPNSQTCHHLTYVQYIKQG